MSSASIEIEPEIKPQCFVGIFWERYPVFDSYDLADNRTYQNYVIRKNPINDDEFKAISKYGRFNYCAITEETPANLLPLVYYEGDGGYMLIADQHIQG